MIWYKRFGEWIEKEACPFVQSAAVGTLAGGPILGAAAALTTTNKRGGNPLGEVGKQAEHVVTPVVQLAGAANLVNKALEEGAKKAAQKAAEELAKKPKVVLC